MQKLKLKNSFQGRVCRMVRRIPGGRVMTYGEIARLVGRPKAYRAVGNILNKNHNLKIPCHRVIRSDGSIGGYNRGVDKKTFLLEKEGVIIENGRADLRKI